MGNILPFVPIVASGDLAVWMRKLFRKVIGILALALAAIFLVFLVVDSAPHGRYGDAFFLVLAGGIGLQRRGVLPGAKSNA